MTPTGWRLVPVKPTKKMKNAANGVFWNTTISERMGAALDAGIAAAPDPLQNEAALAQVRDRLLEWLDWSEDAQEWTLAEDATPESLARAVLALFRGEGK